MLWMFAALLLLMPAQRSEEYGVGPAPSRVPVSWELELRFDDPQRIEVSVPGQGTQVYWYMTYTVVNPGDRSQRFFPTFQITTDDMQVIDTDLGIHPAVFQAIRDRYRIRYKYLLSPTEVMGELQIGEDNARESVAIWRPFELTVDKFTVYIAGLSGETRLVRNPQFDPERPETERRTGTDGRTREIVVNPRTFTLRKTLEIRYSLPGSPKARPFVRAERGEMRWIMR
jgi:hypothetical protein